MGRLCSCVGPMLSSPISSRSITADDASWHNFGCMAAECGCGVQCSEVSPGGSCSEIESPTEPRDTLRDDTDTSKVGSKPQQMSAAESTDAMNTFSQLVSFISRHHAQRGAFAAPKRNSQKGSTATAHDDLSLISRHLQRLAMPKENRPERTQKDKKRIEELRTHMPIELAAEVLPTKLPEIKQQVFAACAHILRDKAALEARLARRDAEQQLAEFDLPSIVVATLIECDRTKRKGDMWTLVQDAQLLSKRRALLERRQWKSLAKIDVEGHEWKDGQQKSPSWRRVDTLRHSWRNRPDVIAAAFLREDEFYKDEASKADASARAAAIKQVKAVAMEAAKNKAAELQQAAASRDGQAATVPCSLPCRSCRQYSSP